MLCNECPRHCNIDRSITTGFCGMSDKIMVARAALHMWEEPCISGEEGSGAVFFSGCNLRCVFCQNACIARGGTGVEITVGRLSEIFLELQGKGANNINLVTPSHYVKEIVQALTMAKDNGLTIPVVYNTSSYELVDTLKCLDGLVDIYLPDFKYVDSSLAMRYSHAKDYYEVACAALDEMHRQIGACSFDERGMMKHGIIVRHLILPGHTADSKRVIKYIKDTYGDDVFISIMNQYTPLPHVSDYPEINRKVTQREYDNVVDYAIDIGVTNGFIQEGGVAEESFIPEFNGEGVNADK